MSKTKHAHLLWIILPHILCMFKLATEWLLLAPKTFETDNPPENYYETLQQVKEGTCIVLGTQ